MKKRRKKKQISLSVVIPCYNEEANLKRGVLAEVRRYLRKQKYKWEVIISDDGSTDNSRGVVAKQISKWSKFKLLKNPHGGKPSALLYGIKKARNDYILFTDMDQSTPIDQLEKLLPFTEKKYYKAIIGSRGISRKNFPIYRRLGAVAFMSFRKFMVLADINDTQCGFKLFERELVSEVFPRLQFFKSNQRTEGWQVTSYDVELLHIVEKVGERIKEVRVEWNDKDESGSKGGSVQRYFRESKEMLGQILRVKLNDIKGEYD